MEKDEWSKQICQMHRIEPKLNIIKILHDNFIQNAKDLEKLDLQEFENKQTLRMNIALQILSLTFELTEDLAAICFSYNEAIENKNKNVPEYLRDFGDPHKGANVGKPNEFYEKVSNEIKYASLMVGLDPVKDLQKVLAFISYFNYFKDFRIKYDDWYQGYKHGQRTLGLYVWPIAAKADKDNIKFIVYRIPQKFENIDKTIFVRSDFIDVITEEEKIYQIAVDSTRAYSEIVSRQYKKVFETV